MNLYSTSILNTSGVGAGPPSPRCKPSPPSISLLGIIPFSIHARKNVDCCRSSFERTACRVFDFGLCLFWDACSPGGVLPAKPVPAKFREVFLLACYPQPGHFACCLAGRPLYAQYLGAGGFCCFRAFCLFTHGGGGVASRSVLSLAFWRPVSDFCLVILAGCCLRSADRHGARRCPGLCWLYCCRKSSWGQEM